MIKWIIFAVLSIGIVIISRRTLFNFRSHGFYRFIAWELIALIFAFNYKYWFKDPFSVNQIFSWVLLIASGSVVIAGVLKLRRSGYSQNTRADENLYHFEKTTKLVDTGIFKYIRHPLYSSLLFLAWGIFLKDPTILTLVLVITASVFLYLTAVFDERECIEYFGEDYIYYKGKTQMFIPFII
jgi:protein-S-isoprenylcysteine O-methyltransferase Ste14